MVLTAVPCRRWHPGSHVVGTSIVWRL